MRVIYKAPGEEPQIILIENNLETLQSLVEGYIEAVPVTDDTVMIVNEEGRLHGLDPNFFVGMLGEFVLGPVVFAGVDGEEFCSVPALYEEQLMRLLHRANGGAEI